MEPESDAMRCNVLITSAGRRGKLVSLFQRELAGLLPAGKVYVTDHRPELSAACQLADGAFSMVRVDDLNYASQLRDLCRSQGIGLIVPTIDTELELLAGERDAFEMDGVQIAVATVDFVKMCRDKRKTADWFAGRGLESPRLIDARGAAKFPIFAKPFDGSCGHGARVVATSAELTPSLLDDPRMMFVEYLAPEQYDEYTVDMYYSRDGALKCLVPRLRIETRAGEVSKSRTARIDAVAAIRELFARIAGVRGCITLQIFVERRTRAIFGIEINPRFGGGYPLSYEAGANFPRWLLEEYLLGKPVESCDDWESDLTMLRYDDHVVVRGAVA